MFGEGHLPEREAERGHIQVVLHAVAAYHDIAQRQARAEAAADAGHQQVVGREAVDSVLRDHRRTRLADTAAQQRHLGGGVPEPNRRERALIR